MRGTAGLVACALALASLGVAAQQATPPATITVSAQGQFQASPDTAVVEMQVNGHDRQLKTAYAQAQAQAEQVRSLLRQQGFAAEQAHWTSYQVQPNMDYKTHTITDYTVTTSLELEVSDFAQIGPLVEAAGAAGLNALRGIRFELKKMDAAKAAAIADGYQRAQLEADALARAAHRSVEGMENASVDVSSPSPTPMPMLMARANVAMAAPTEEFTPGWITVTAHIQAVFRLRP